MLGTGTPAKLMSNYWFLMLKNYHLSFPLPPATVFTLPQKKGASICLTTLRVTEEMTFFFSKNKLTAD